MEDLRLLKKHANRRIYDTQVKKYVSLEEIRDLINSGVDVRIEDSGSGDDITRPVLLQILAECEQGDRPMLPPEMLMALIRHYGHPMQDVIGTYLERSLAFYIRQEARLRKRMTGLLEPRDGRQGGWPTFGSDALATMRDNLMQALKSGKDE